MKKYAFLIVIALVGSIHFSASKHDILLGKWEVYKMRKEGKVEKVPAKEKIPWLEFNENNVLKSGEGGKKIRKAEWSYEEEDKALYIIRRGDQMKFDVVKLTPKKLILETKERNKKMKIFLRKVS